MPERRSKVKSPSPQMTSTPKVKRKGYVDDDTSEMRSRLGLKDSVTSSKTEVSHESLELTSEYTDGTTRPTFKKRLRNTTANAGEVAQLECVVSGSPLPKVLWLKNNRPLKASDGCKVIIDEDKNILVFPSASDEDVGIYTARAMNVNGSIMCSAEFTLKEGKSLPAQAVIDSPMDLDFTTPAYFFQMSSCEVAEGRLARFDCRVVAYPRPDIVWMRDGKVIESSDRFKLLNFNNEIYSLLIQDVRLSDTGRYTCWARNKFGEAMTEAYLNVIAFKEEEEEGDIAPKFLTKFYDQQTTEGTPTDFKCLIAGRPDPDVAWLLNDLEIRDSPGVRMRRKDGVVCLEIKSPKIDQSGKYTCQLKNPLGEATCSAKLTVIEDKLKGKMLPKFLKKFDHINAREGEEAKFTCVVVGEPKPNVTWMYNHKPIDDGNRRYVMKKEGDAYTLTIKDARFDDKGIITCKASNEEGEVYISANLNIRESKKLPEAPVKDRKDLDVTDSKFGYVPTFTKRLEDVSAKEGTSARFECRVMGIPEPEVSWMKDGRVILPGGRYHMTYADGTCRLTIDNVSSADTGVYTCIISNSQGKSSSTASLKLETEKKDTFAPDKPAKRELFTPDTYGLQDKPKAKRPAYKGPLVDMEKIEDMARKFADLPEMRAPPRLPTHRPIVTDMGEDVLRLAWRPAETYQAKRAPPVSYRLEAKELPGKDWMPLSSRLRDTSHYLSELPLDRDYMIRVRAENDFGISEPTESLWLPRARAFPGVPITRPEIVEVEDTRAKLKWTRVDIPSFGLNEEPLLYMLEVEEPPYDWRTIARDLDDTEYIVEGLKPGKDYRFRIRAKTPAGVVSEPSPAASLYSTFARSRAPVDRLELVDFEPDSRSVNLQWQRVDIPPYTHDEEPLLYMVEYQEPPLPEWRSLVTGVPTTKYRVMHLDPDRDYNFRVRAVTPYGVSPPSPVLPVSLRKTTVPTYLPLGEPVVISDIEPDSLRLTWKRPTYDSTAPFSYRVEMLEYPFGEWISIASSIPETTYRVTGLKPNRDYQFRVTPQVDRRYLDPLPPVSLTSSTGEPESATQVFLNMIQKEKVRPRLPLTEPTLRELTSESVSLHWKPAEVPVYQRSRAPLYYTIEMLELPSSTWTPVARRIPDTSYTVTGLRPDVDYKFRIKAEIGGHLSEPSLAAVLHRRPVPKFPRKEPTIKDISPNIVQLSWQPAVIPAGFDDISYRVEIQTPPGISTWNTLYASHPTPSVRLADLRPDLDYLVRVRAVGKDFVSEPTMPVFIPRRAVPPRMTNEEPYCVEINPDYVKLQWRSAELPSHIMDYSPITYRLEAQEMPNGEWIVVSRGIPHTDFKVTGLNPLKDYSFRVRAENDYGVSDPTRPVTVHKRAVAPVLPHDEPIMYDVGLGSVRLTWRPATLPSHVKSLSPITYTIFVQELPFKAWRPLVKKIPHTSYYISGLQPDKEYNFRIQAENEHGQSRPTQAVYLPKYTEIKKPISIPEVSDFDEDLTFVKLRWKPRAGPPFDKSPHKYRIETWEPVKREWKPVARGIKDTAYQLRDLPKLPDHLFRVRMETEQAELSEPSLPVSVSKHVNYPRRPVYRPQLFEYDNDSVRLSWQAATLPEGVSRRSIRYVIEQREIPDLHWHAIASDVTETSYRVRGLRPKSDYEFRIRVHMSGTTSEPSFPVALYRRPVIPRVQLQAPEVYDVDDTTIQLRWNKVDVPSFTGTDEPLMFMIERQTLPGYRWEPIAMDITDTSYTIRNLQPYQDYNFRVRGVYPSGYTDPSPFVPVFRRPSESKKSIVGSYTAVDSEITTQMYSSQPLPTQSLKASLPSDYSPSIRTAKHSRLVTKRFSMPQKYDISDQKELSEAPFRASVVPPVQFKREEAYVYNRGTSPAVPKDIKATKVSKTETKVFDRKNDLYDYYVKLRRHSDAGLEDRRRARSESSRERELQARRELVMLESEMVTRRRASPSPVARTKRPVVAGTSDYHSRYPSVADRYEDIKCPHVVRPGHWSFARRHSIALDDQDLEQLKRARARSASQSRVRSKTQSKTDLDIDYGRSSEYYGNTFFIIEDDMDYETMKPMSRISRVDIPSPLRTMEIENEPGYFVFSRFSLSVSGSRRSSPSSYVRPASVEPSPTMRAPSRPVSYDRYVDSYSQRPRSQSFSVTKTDSEWEKLTRSVKEQIEKAQELRQKRRASINKQIDRATRVVSMAKSPADRYRDSSPPKPQSRPRSYSVSERPPKFNALVENTKSLVAKTSERGASVDLRMQESHTGYRSRTSSVSKPKEQTRSRAQSVADVKSDSRYSQQRRASITATQITVEKRRSSVADIRTDSRGATPRRSTISSTNDDLKSKLDTLTSKLSVAKPKKSSRPVIKFRSSHGEGYVTESYVPKSDKLKGIYHQLK